MTSDNLGNGAAKTEDRFAGQIGYRTRGGRDGGTLSSNNRGDGPRGAGPMNGGPMGGGILSSITPLGLGNPLGAPLGARGATPLDGPLDVVSDDFSAPSGGMDHDPLHIENPIASALLEPKLPDPEPVRAELPFRGPTDSWSDSRVMGLVDHPLLRGLLLELPPKGATLQVQWLDRWFEAARSILELLYQFEDKGD